MAAKTPPTTPNTPQTAEAPKKKGKLLLIASVVLVLLGGGGGAAAYLFMKPAAEGEEAAKAPEVKSVFLPLETFTVNLLPGDSQPQYLQAGLTLKLDNEATSERVKTHMPEVRNRLLLMLSSQRSQDLLPTEGKERLAKEVAVTIEDIINPPKPRKKSKKAVEDEESTDEKPAKAAKAKAEDEDAEPKAKSPKSAKAREPEHVQVLFTSFIIQ